MRLLAGIILLFSFSSFAAKKCHNLEGRVKKALEAQAILSERGVRGPVRSEINSLLDRGVEIDPMFFSQVSFRKGYKTTKFNVKAKKADHVKEHMDSLGAISEKHYQRLATKFASSNNETIITFRSKKEIYRYDPTTNEYLIIDRSGKAIETFYKPSLKTINAARKKHKEPPYKSVMEWFVKNKWERYILKNDFK